MENMIWEMIIVFVLWYMLFIIAFIFCITTIIYFTYRFWKMILPKEEVNVFINNAPVIWHNYNIENNEDNNNFTSEEIK